MGRSYPNHDITAETVARAFISGWIPCFGVPSIITTDRGHQFESTLRKQLMDLLDLLGYIPLDNIISLQTVSLNVLNNNLKLYLSLTPYLNCWTVSLSIILLGIRTAINPNIGCTPAKLIYSTTLCLPGAFFNPTDNSVTIDPADYVQNVKSNLLSLHAVPP